MFQERIRILVDRSRDAGWADDLVNMEPDNIYHTTDNRKNLDWSVLKNYDVLVMCGYSPLKYTNDELKLIEKFVEIGGGLLLASSTSRFQQDTDKSSSEMSLNEIARVFGAEFLPVGKCKAETELDDNLLQGYQKKSLRILYHAVLAELELDDIPIENCGTIAVPEDAEVFLEHSETNEPVGACLKFGSGRVLLINDLKFSHSSQITCRAFVDWLSCNRISKNEGSETIPSEILLDEYIKEDGNIRIYYADLVKDRVDKCLEFAKKIREELTGALDSDSKAFWEIELAASCCQPRNWWRSRILRIGAFTSDSRLAYILGTRVMHTVDAAHELEHKIWYSGLGGGIPKYFGITTMRILGFDNEADGICSKYEEQFRKIDSTGREFDITKTYDEHPKAVWILNSLGEKFGQDFLIRFAKAIPKQDGDPKRRMPGRPFNAMDLFIYYLSLGLETDLYPWFQEIGITVHPLPLNLSDDEFKNSVMQYLKDVIRNKGADAIDREDAVMSLISYYEDDNKQASEKDSPPAWKPADELKSEDKCNRLVAAVQLHRLSDSRSVHVLEEIASDDDDRGLAAIAAYALVQKGIVSAGDRLAETAKGQDRRFQLDAGYALEKIGHKKADELSYRGLKDENGKLVVDMKTQYDGYLKLYPTVAGHKVANIFSAPNIIRHFPENTHINCVYIDWVHTGPFYRRKGLARWTMQQTFEHESIRRASCAFLGTGTRNTAHAMYRSFGFVDVFLSESFNMDLDEEDAVVVEGLIIRPYSPGDEVKMAILSNEFYSQVFDYGYIRPRRLREKNTCVKIAEKDGELIGYVEAHCQKGRSEVSLNAMHVKKTDNRYEVGAALLAALHSDLSSSGFKKISMDRVVLMSIQYIRTLLRNFGYSQRETGGVDMFKIVNLPMLMEEVSTLLISRLKASDYKDWHGSVGIAGEQHKAAININEGQMSVSEEVPADVDILISGDDDTIARIIVGRMTPFEAYLQTELTIKPMVNDRVTGLLETIFPRIPKDGL